MAVNETRSMNRELAEGASDGVVKKLTPDRGGVTDAHAAAAVHGSLGEQYGSNYTSGSTQAYRATTLHG